MAVAREYPAAPLVGVGALIFQDESILLIRRGREPMKGEWSLPGGRLELGETLHEGVAREVLEETGLLVEAIVHVETLDRIVGDDDGRVRYHYVLIDFLCEVRDGNLLCGDDAIEAVWMPLSSLRSRDVYIAPFTLEVIEKAWAIRQASW